MSERPIFVPVTKDFELVKELFFPSGGIRALRLSKRKRISLHSTRPPRGGYSPLLEISCKSEAKVGRHLSAFHLRVRLNSAEEVPLECAFQSSKVFEHGGPYTDLYDKEPRDAKADPRLKNSGQIIAFRLGDLQFPLEPKTAFYDWLYLNAIYPHREWCQKLLNYAGFTDIEFNPSHSINCQARSCALFLPLLQREVLDAAVSSPHNFLQILASIITGLNFTQRKLITPDFSQTSDNLPVQRVKPAFFLCFLVSHRLPPVGVVDDNSPPQGC